MFHLLVNSPNSHDSQGESQVPGAKNSVWVFHMDGNYLNYELLFPKVFVSRKLKLGAELGFKPRNFSMGC